MKKVFIILTFILAIFSLSVNVIFIKDPQKVTIWKELIKTKLNQTEKEKSIKANPEVYAFFNKLKFATKTEQIDFCRQWIFQNSYGTGDTNYIDAFDPKLTLKDIYNSSLNKSHKPPMTCGPRALALEELLFMLGYQTRIASIYFSSDSLQIGSHTFMEVYNPDFNHWEIHDPLNDIYYIDSTGRRLNTLEMSYMNRSDYMPCVGKGKCGFELLTDDITRYHDSFKLISIRPKKSNFIHLLNSKYFDINKIYKTDGTTIEGYFHDAENIIVF